MKNKSSLIFIILIFLVFILFLIYDNIRINKKIDILKDDVMYIEKVKFSKETEQILSLVDEELLFFDYKLDNTIKSIKIDFWSYIDGNWTSFEGYSSNLELTKKRDDRIGIKINDNNCYVIYDFKKNDYLMSVFEKSIKFENPEILSKRNLGYIRIEPNKEIVLFEKYSYDDREKQEFNKFGDFRNEKCEKGLVVTITFFDKKTGG